MTDPLRIAMFASEAERQTAERDEVVRLNRTALLTLMKEHSLFIRAQDFPFWRPTVRTSGEIPGVWEAVEIIATDGLLGYFVNMSSGAIVTGHIQHFSGEVRTMFSMKKEQPIKRATSRRGKKTVGDAARELLESLLNK